MYRNLKIHPLRLESMVYHTPELRELPVLLNGEPDGIMIIMVKLT